MAHPGRASAAGRVYEWDGTKLIFGVPSSPMGSTGEAEIDFGVAQSNNAEVVVTGQGGILSGSEIQVWISASSTTTDHNETEHILATALMAVCAGTIVPGVGFTIYGTSLNMVAGKFKVQWSWF